MNITITPGAATEDAVQIDSIVSEMEEEMETLNSAIKRTIPAGIQTTWSEEVESNWNQYYTSDIPEAMAEMKLSAETLSKAIEESLAYDLEKK